MFKVLVGGKLKIHLSCFSYSNLPFASLPSPMPLPFHLNFIPWGNPYIELFDCPLFLFKQKPLLENGILCSTLQNSGNAAMKIKAGIYHFTDNLTLVGLQPLPSSLFFNAVPLTLIHGECEELISELLVHQAIWPAKIRGNAETHM